MDKKFQDLMFLILTFLSVVGLAAIYDLIMYLGGYR